MLEWGYKNWYLLGKWYTLTVWSYTLVSLMNCK